MRPLRHSRRALLALASVALAACSDAPTPDVILITLDTTRADHLSLYGYERETSPALERIAAGARVFEAAMPTATWTLPSHASIFTGLHPAEHGCYLRPDPDEPGQHAYAALAPSLPTLSSRLALAGYRTVGAVGGPFTSQRYGFQRGFEHWLEPGPRWQLPGEELVDYVDTELSGLDDDDALLLFVNFFDAHAPHDPAPRAHWPFPEGVGDLPAIDHPEGAWSAGNQPPAGWVQSARDQYDRELLVQDEALERLFDVLERHGRLEHALVFITSDHGEAFGEQAQFGHGNLPYEPVARVPLIVLRTHAPLVDRVATPVSNLSIASTVLDALELEPLPGARGVDLLAPVVAEEAVWVEQRDPEGWVGVLRRGSFKYVRPVDSEGLGANEILLDLARDPGESSRASVEEAPLTAEDVETGLELRAAFDALRADWRAQPPDAQPVELTEAERAGLDHLGYGGD